MIGVLDFAELPPEVNSARMYAGPGAESLTAAAAAWQALAAELGSTASSYRAVVSGLTSGPWVGPSSGSMAAAVAPYLTWMTATAAQAAHTAGQLGAAAAAYEAAFAATVPPVEIEVNRALLASLLATNTFGQNTPAIASTEAQYAEMWAQDAAAMYGYAGASAAATRLTAFGTPPPTTNQAGTTSQGPAVGNAAAAATGSSTQSTLANVPNLLQGMSAPAASAPAANPIIDYLNGPNPILNTLNSYPFQTFHTLSAGTVGYQILSEGLNFDASGAMLTLAPPVAAAWNPLVNSLSAPAAAAPAAGAAAGAGLASNVAGTSGAGASAGLGEAATVGNLSVPPSWGGSPAIRLAATALPATALDGSPLAGLAAPGTFYGGMPPMGPVASVVNAPRGEGPRARSRHKVVAALPGEQEDPAAPWVKPGAPADGDGAVSERDELNQLRKAVADVTRQRDVLKRTAATLIKEGTQK
ncbi:PPE family protein [Mycobacterium sp. 852002-50816_SCH5313054-b]|uniref:PPE family protein n=1 Tax=Mycobacterium sp. 852002-50816_SCH5313054-b TaxID=1834092 RepID=UPI000A91289B|nr:PPE domain-containing protein [Mycobacterium sp. 852002-50816_SCH5313054-b]